MEHQGDAMNRMHPARLWPVVTMMAALSGCATDATIWTGAATVSGFVVSTAGETAIVVGRTTAYLLGVGIEVPPATPDPESVRWEPAAVK